MKIFKIPALILILAPLALPQGYSVDWYVIASGGGQLSWVAVSAVAGAEMSNLLDIIERQNIKIEELNNKIAELERRIE